AAGGTGRRVAREPLTGCVARSLSQRARSGPVGERATAPPGQDPQRLLSGDYHPAMPIDRAFSRRAGFQAYLIAAFSLVYAVVFLGFVHNHPENIGAAALAWALIAGAGLSATIATVAQAEGAILVTGGLASVILVPAFWIWTGRALRT